MPTTYRRWYMNRLVRHFKEMQDGGKENVGPSENLRKVDEYISKL